MKDFEDVKPTESMFVVNCEIHVRPFLCGLMREIGDVYDTNCREVNEEFVLEILSSKISELRISNKSFDLLEFLKELPAFSSQVCEYWNQGNKPDNVELLMFYEQAIRLLVNDAKFRKVMDRNSRGLHE